MVLGIMVCLFVILPCIGWVANGFIEGFDWGWPDTHPFNDFYGEHIYYGLCVSLILGGAVAIGFVVKLFIEG